MLRLWKSSAPGKVLLLTVLILAGFLGNCTGLSMFFAINLIFGSIAVWIVLDLFGIGWAVFAGVVAGSSTFYLWGHPYCMIILSLEPLLVGLAMRSKSRNFLLLDALFWFLVGLPLGCFFYGVVMGMDFTLVRVFLLKQINNGIFNAVVAMLVLNHLPIRRLAGKDPDARSVSIRTTTFALFVAMALVPAVLIVVENGREARQRLEAEIQEVLRDASSDIATDLQLWYRVHLRGASVLASLASDAGMVASGKLGYQTELLSKTFPDFRSMLIFDAGGARIAFHSPPNDQEPPVALDGPCFQRVLQEGRPCLSDIMSGNGEGRPPAVFLVVPVNSPSGTGQAGFVVGVLDMDKISAHLSLYRKTKDLHIVLTDLNGMVIAHTQSDQGSSPDFSVPGKGAMHPVAGSIYHWIPDQKNTTSLLRLEKSYYVLDSRVSEEIPWKLRIIEPAGPHLDRVLPILFKELCILLGLTFLAFPLAHYFSRWLARPLVKLTSLTTDLPDKLTEQQEIDWSIRSAAEINSLVSNFKTMASALKQNFQALQGRTAELQMATSSLSALIEASPLAVISLDQDLRVEIWNPAAERIFGWSAAEVIGRSLPYVPTGSEKEHMKLVQVGFKGEVLVDYPLRRQRKDGSMVDVSIWTSPMPDAGGGVRRTLALMVDMTKRQKELQALQESEERFRKIFEEGPLGMALVSPDLRIVKVNNKLCEMLGYLPEELTGLTTADITHPEDLQNDVDLAVRLFAGEIQHYDIEKRYATRDRDYIWTHLTATIIRDGEGAAPFRLAMILDITERKRAQKELTDSEERLKALFEYAPDPFYLLDLNGRLVDGNKAAEAITGYVRADMVGKTLFELRLLSRRDLNRATKLLALNALGNPTGPDEFTIICKDGRGITLEQRAFPTVIGGQTLVLGIARDITERKRMEAEHRSIEGQLRQAQKMEAIGTLAGGIAHDFNNILSAIIGYSELALAEASHDERLRYALDQILSSGFRARDLVKQILAFSRQGKQEKKPLKLGTIVKEVVKLLKATIPSSIDIVANVSSEFDWVYGDATQMHQVLMNLCTNASHAMKEGMGVLRISMAEVSLGEEIADKCPELDAGRYLKLEVSDTGHGMSVEVLERIFEPYFTTKGVGEGTGLGLAVVQGIVKEHGGTITVESEPGKGTTVKVFLPRMEPVKEEQRRRVSSFIGSAERILYVDDEQALMELGKMMLERLGYDVTARNSSPEALETFRKQPEGFDIVITDLAMPKLRGTELVREIRKIRPGIPVILCTGFTHQLDREKARAVGVNEIVLKPIIFDELAAAIGRIMKNRSGGDGGKA